jgi:hypothetical protein
VGQGQPKTASVRRAFGVRRFADLVIADPRRCAEARLVKKPVHTDAGKTLPQHASGMRAIIQLGGDFLVGQPIRPGQNDALARPRRPSLRIRAVNARRSASSKTTSTARPPPFSPPLLIGENVTDLPIRRLANAAVHGDFSARDITGLVRGKKKR